MIGGSSGVAVTTERWLPLVQRAARRSGARVFWLPVGSNIPPVPTTAATRRKTREELGLSEADVVVAAFKPTGSGKLPDWIGRAWRVIRSDPSAALIIIGVPRDDMEPAGRLPHEEARVVYTGFLEPHEVSACLHCADLCLAPFSDGVSARRTTVVAAFAHGLPVVTTRGKSTDGLFDESPAVLTNSDEPGEFVAATRQLFDDAGRRQALSAETRRFVETHFEWRMIASRLLREAESIA
jgi:glycosyltransferase involved in cell wall biosynthesis